MNVRGIFSALALLTVAAGPVAGAELPVSADVHVNSAFPDLNFGASPFLQTGGVTRTFLRFDTSSLPAGVLASPIARVNLVLWVGQVGAGGNLQASDVSGAWAENSLTWNTQPGIGGVVGSVAVPGAAQFVSIDVTASFARWLNSPASNFGLVIDAVPSSGSFFLDSKESVTTSHSPALEIVLGGPAGATGAIGATGAAGPAGLIGATGQAGNPGVAGATGATGTGLNWRGNWSNGAIYSVNDVVAFGGSAYVSLIGANTNNTPAGSPAAWSLMAAQGSTGVTGAQGSTGAQGIVGATGAVGPQGNTGNAGVNGINGATGAVGATGTSLNWRGVWSNSTTYAANDAVSFGGSAYVSLTGGNTNNGPDTSPSAWSLMAAQGSTGATGAQGVVGPTGAQGSIGAQGNTGNAGANGINGATGAAGTGLNWRSAWSGSTTYAANDAVSFGGSAYVSLVGANTGNPPNSSPSSWSLMAAQGNNGATGAQGSVGPQGNTGNAGANGINGATGATGAAGVSLNWRGAWSGSTTYAANDAVSFGGSAYVSLVGANTGNPPNNSPSDWSLMAAQGNNGATGAPVSYTHLTLPTIYSV